METLKILVVIMKKKQTQEKFKPLVEFEGFEPETLLSQDHWPLQNLVECFIIKLSGRTCEVPYGLGKIDKNLVTNTCEIEDDYKYHKYHAEGVRFIAEHLRKQSQQLMRVAKSTLEKIDVEYEVAVEMLGKNVSMA